MKYRAGGAFVAVLAGASVLNVYTGIITPTRADSDVAYAASAEYGECPKNPPNKVLPDGQLNACINAALMVMKAHKIPGSFDGIKRNIIRESGGNPRIVNDWDVNARNGTPSIGLLQVIQPTFDAHHVPGTVNSPYDPIANISAASHYAFKRYKSIDNVNGPY